jgi:hypothetical protein
VTDVLEQLVTIRDEFRQVRCCGILAGVVNTRPFTPAAINRFCEIQNRIGNDWRNDPEAKELLADPTSYAPPPDGTPCAFTCKSCGAAFLFVGGVPIKRGVGRP